MLMCAHLKDDLCDGQVDGGVEPVPNGLEWIQEVRTQLHP